MSGVAASHFLWLSLSEGCRMDGGIRQLLLGTCGDCRSPAGLSWAVCERDDLHPSREHFKSKVWKIFSPWKVRRGAEVKLWLNSSEVQTTASLRMSVWM